MEHQANELDHQGQEIAHLTMLMDRQDLVAGEMALRVSSHRLELAAAQQCGIEDLREGASELERCGCGGLPGFRRPQWDVREVGVGSPRPRVAIGAGDWGTRAPRRCVDLLQQQVAALLGQRQALERENQELQARLRDVVASKDQEMEQVRACGVRVGARPSTRFVC